VRLAGYHCTCHGTDNEQRVDGEDPSWHGVCDPQSLFLEQHVVLSDCYHQDDRAVYPEEHVEGFDHPGTGVGDSVSLHAVQNQRDGDPVGAEEQSLDGMVQRSEKSLWEPERSQEHRESEQREEHQVQDEEDLANRLQAVELVGCLAENDGESSGRHCRCEPGPCEVGDAVFETCAIRGPRAVHVPVVVFVLLRVVATLSLSQRTAAIGVVSFDDSLHGGGHRLIFLDFRSSNAIVGRDIQSGKTCSPAEVVVQNNARQGKAKERVSFSCRKSKKRPKYFPIARAKERNTPFLLS
jgi:hypothetical protein